MSVATMMTATMMRTKNIALAPLNDSWALAAGRRPIPGVWFQTIPESSN
jgi:hypothetical protein